MALCFWTLAGAEVAEIATLPLVVPSRCHEVALDSIGDNRFATSSRVGTTYGSGDT